MLLGMLPVCELCKPTGQTEDNFSSVITEVILLDPGNILAQFRFPKGLEQFKLSPQWILSDFLIPVHLKVMKWYLTMVLICLFLISLSNFL